MKNYTITVNGNVYDVVVEEGTSTGAPVAARCSQGSPQGGSGSSSQGGRRSRQHQD